MTLMAVYCEHEGIPEYADKAGGPSPVEREHKLQILNRMFMPNIMLMLML